MSTVEARLKGLGLVLPPAPAPAANYQSWKEHGGLLHISGRGARTPEGKPVTGRLGAGLTTAEGYQHARIAGLLILSIARAASGSLDRLEVVRVFGMVNAAPEFLEHSKVVDGCSDLFIDVLGDHGRHARSAIGVASLPNGMSIEIETTFAFRD